MWVYATEGELHLLLGQWDEAERSFQAARDQANYTKFHSDSTGKQAERIVQIYQQLGQKVTGRWLPGLAVNGDSSSYQFYRVEG